MPKRISRADVSGKTCSRCGEYKDYAMFSPHSSGVGGRQSQCKTCVAQAHRLKKADRPCQRCGRPIGDASIRWAKFCPICRRSCTECGERPRLSHCRRCGECQAEFSKAYRSGSERSFRRRWLLIQRKYKVSKEDAIRLASIDICESCGKRMTRPGESHVDHCHVTGLVRGVLCFNCNCALGHVGDSVERLKLLMRYLSRSAAGT